MNFRDFRIGWRLLFQEPAHSIIVLLGLAVGFAVCFLLLGFVHHSFSYDAALPDSERIYLVKTQFNYRGVATPWRQRSTQVLTGILEKSGLPLESSGFLGTDVSLQANRVLQEIKLTLVGPGFPKVFGINALEGDLQAALTRPDALALTEEVARLLFGQTHVVGKTVEIAGKPYLVAAILKDPPSTTTFPYTALAGINSATLDEEQRKANYGRWGLLKGNVFIKLGDGVSVATVTRMLQDAVDHSPLVKEFSAELLAKLGARKLMELQLSPLRNAYLDPDIAADANLTPHGDVRALLGLAAIALLILLLAATNYVNLATVRTLRRQREIAVRKVMGASVRRVIGQFLAESILVALLATGLGLLLALAAQPAFSALVDRKLDDLFAPVNLLASVLLGLVLGILTGAYPMWVALHVRPAAALSGRGNSETASGLWIRRVLTVLQFSTAMGLCGVCLAIAWQTDYATKLDPGFDPDPLLVIDMSKDLRDPDSKAFFEEAGRQPGVAAVAVAWDAVGRQKVHLVDVFQRSGAAGVSMEVKGISPDFFKVYGVLPRAGRLFDATLDKADADSLVINGAAATALGFASPQAAVGQFILQQGDDKPHPILGVAPEIRFGTLRQTAEPLVYGLADNAKTLTVRVNGDSNTVSAVQAGLENLWQRRFSNQVLHLARARTFFALEYADDLRMSKILASATLIAIVIAAFGIYVLSAYSIQRRSQEIVLRKLYGASRSAIARLVGREFLTLIFISAAVGLPLAWIAIERYLAPFLERAPIGIWPLVTAFAVALLIALMSTLRHTWSAMRISPAQILQR
jgi:putative ABC transport system permease protein